MSDDDAQRNTVVFRTDARLAVDVPRIDLIAEMARWEAMTPEERAAERATRAAQRERAERLAARARAEEREAADTVGEPDLVKIAEWIGMGQAFLVHLSQPYCRCELTRDGLEACEHWYDETGGRPW